MRKEEGKSNDVPKRWKPTNLPVSPLFLQVSPLGCFYSMNFEDVLVNSKHSVAKEKRQRSISFFFSL